MTEPLTLIVPSEWSGERLDRYLAEHVAGRSRNQIQALIRDGYVLLEGHRTRPSQIVATGDSIRIMPASDEAAGEPTADGKLPLHVIHADEALIAVDKPAGQVVHPAAGHHHDTLVNALLARYPDLGRTFPGDRPGIVHRLDRDTSGVLVVARTRKALESLQGQFKRRTVEKVYVALVKGLLSPPAGVIDAPIGRDPARRKRMAAVPDGRPAQTIYRLLAASGNYSLVEVKPQTGRTHQIRVHLAAVGHPVAGDAVYGRKDRLIPRPALHSWQLSVDHPESGEKIRFGAPLPPDMLRALESLGIDWED